MNPPALASHQSKADEDHLQLLAVFHFVLAGVSLLGILFLFAHYSFMGTIFNNPEMWKSPGQTPPPDEFFTMFKWFYLIAGILCLVTGVLNVISGFCLRRKTHRMFSMIVAGLNCLQMPLGTALGVFTFIVLIRPSVRESYAG